MITLKLLEELRQAGLLNGVCHEGTPWYHR